MKLYTIGFTKKSAEIFFETLRRSGATRVVDVRLNNVSQLAGFSKREDLAYFLEKICGMEYSHLPILAPTLELLDEYRKRRIGWPTNEQRFLDLIKARKIEDNVPRDVIADGCLLCSEDKPYHCHRRLVAQYLNKHWSDVDVNHLG
jgi:uncharacterized protein (DUF488 family)